MNSKNRSVGLAAALLLMLVVTTACGFGEPVEPKEVTVEPTTFAPWLEEIEDEKTDEVRTTTRSGGDSINTTTFSADIPDAVDTRDICAIATTTEGTLEEGRAIYADICEGYPQPDCDPLHTGGWQCSSVQIGAYSPTWVLDKQPQFGSTSVETDDPIVEEPPVVVPDDDIIVVSGCDADSEATLRGCISSGEDIGLTSDIAISGCPALSFNSETTLDGNGYTILRTAGQRSCSLVEVFNETSVAFKSVVFDDDANVPACTVGDNCPRMVYVKDSGLVSFDEVDITNSKGYALYTDNVNGFSYTEGSMTNAGVLGMYIGHGTGSPSRNVIITGNDFISNSTNGLAVLGADEVLIRDNLFENNHYIGQWPVEPQYGTGLTGGGQVYIARATNIDFIDNTIINGSCDLCLGGISGLEVGLPNVPASVSGLDVEGNTIKNHTGFSMFINQGSTVPNVEVANNTLSDNTLGVGAGLDGTVVVPPVVEEPPVVEDPVTPDVDEGGIWSGQADMRNARVEGTVIQHGVDLYVFNGFQQNFILEPSFEKYDGITRQWTDLGDVPYPVTHNGLILVGDDVWMIGGRRNTAFGPVTNDVEIYNLTTGQWRGGPDLPTAIGGGGAAYINGNVHWIGGFDAAGQCDSDLHYVYDVSAATGWVSGPSMPKARNHYSTVVLDDVIYTIGGQNGHDGCQKGADVTDVHSFNPATNQWTELAGIPSANSHAEAAAFAYEGLIYMVGGERNKGGVYRYNPVSNTWTNAYVLPENSFASVSRIIGGRLIIAGGSIAGVDTPHDNVQSRQVDLTPTDPVAEEPPVVFTLATSAGDTRASATALFNATYPNETLADCDPVGTGFVCANIIDDLSAVEIMVGSLPIDIIIDTPTDPVYEDGFVQAAQTVLPASNNTHNPAPSHKDSYSHDGKCYIDSTFDHGANVEVDTPVGRMTVREVHELIGSGPGSSGNPLYNDVQCGNGPANDFGDEDPDQCPGRVDIGVAGCRIIGPTWAFPTKVLVTTVETRSIVQSNISKDLYALHYDVCPDKDDIHAMVAGYAALDDIDVQVQATIGTCGTSISDRYDDDGEVLFYELYPDGLNAASDFSGAVATAATLWEDTIRAGYNVYVAEGGQSDYTASVIRAVDSGLDRKKITVVQHSTGYNEGNTSAANLDYIRATGTYVVIDNGNSTGNGSADLASWQLGIQDPEPFIDIALDSKFSRYWIEAFSQLSPYCLPQSYTCRIDFSDTVEVLYIIDDQETTDLISFANKYLK